MCYKSLKAISITGQSTTVGTLLDGTGCKIHLVSGTTKSFMPNQYNVRDKSLHGLPKLSSKAEVI